MPEPRWTRRAFLRACLVGSGALAVTSCTRDSNAHNLTFQRRTIAYGPDPMQSGELYVAQLSTPRPVVVLIHGGSWQNGFTRAEMVELAEDLAREGYATWNIDYRRLGDAGGGWDGTIADVALAVDKLAELAPANNLDLNRVAVMGHSAGAQLALWAASRTPGRPGQPGGDPLVRPKAAVSLSGVVDLVVTAEYTTPGTELDLAFAVRQLLGGTPAEQPGRYAATSPIALLPLGIPQLLLHGSKDGIVPVEQSRSYVVAAAKAGDQAKLIELPNLDHFDVVRTDRNWWDQTLAWMATAVGDPLS